MRVILLAASLILLGACSRGGGDQQNFGVASGNSLSPAEIDAALGPANQQAAPANETASANVETANAGNRDQAGPARKRRAAKPSLGR